MATTGFIKMKNGFIIESDNGTQRVYIKHDAIIAMKQNGEGAASSIRLIMNDGNEFKVDGYTIEQIGINL